MELKAGYKQTEAGVIPEDWKLEELQNVASFLDGRRKPVKSSDRAKMRGSVPYYGASGIVDYVNDFIFDEELILLGEDGENILSRNLPLAFRISGKTWVNNHAHVLKPNPDISIGFLTEYLESLNYETLNSGTAQPKLNKQKCSAIPIALPPTKAEQEAIAKALSDADALIESLEQLIAKKRQIKQGAMQELLTGKKRLPGFSGEWEVKRLGDVADPTRRWSFTGGPFGSNLKSSDYTDEGVRIIQLQNIGDGEFKDDYEIHTSAEKADELVSCNIYPGDLILSKMGDPVARACIIPPLCERYLMCSDGIRLAVDKRHFNTYFVYTLINAPEFRKKAENAGTGSTRKRIGLTELRALTLYCPSFDEQTAIAEILSDMGTEIAALGTKLSKARQIKQGMTQELLTGRIRLV